MDSRRENIIVALDVGTAKEALELVDQLKSGTSFFKIGLQLFTVAGPLIVRQLLDQGCKVFLDLKLHDIPNTVAGAVSACASLGVQMATIHLAGGRDMITAAIAARTPGLRLLGVTVLTSMDKEGLREIGVSHDPAKQVLHLAALGLELGIDGLVASPHELKDLRAVYGPKPTLVVPGIRPSSAANADQRRVMTPAEAVALGADYIVIGRPIIAHAKPAEALQRIIGEIESNHGGL
jgi:orotidine-5'-phosphate decarboxylase